MTWLTWRQFRAQAVIALAALTGFAILLAVTGPNLARLYTVNRIGSCQGGPADCGSAADDFLQGLFGALAYANSDLAGTGTYWLLFMLGIVTILVTPALIGIFWGAPLIAGEFEAGTHHLVWTQSVTRNRWLVVKLAVIGLAAMAVTEALSLMEGWWATPISKAVALGAVASPLAMNQFSPLVFATRGITPLGYAAFAFALGVTVGVLVRRTLPAMALTLAVFALLQVAMPLWVRPHLLPPEQSVTALSAFGEVDVLTNGGNFTLIPGGWDRQPEGWVLSSGAVNAAGQPVDALPATCMQLLITQGQGKASHSALLDCLASNGIRVAITYQPAERYWAFQWTETAIYVALALALSVYCFWRLNRRLS